jgi:pantetheine-phosphate adenylyltransferase
MKDKNKQYNTRAIFAGSFDPIHYGHINLIQRAARTFDELTVAIGKNPLKNYMFDLEERLDMTETSLSYLQNVKVDSFDGLLVRYAFEKGIYNIVKGLRNNEDLNFETLCYEVGKTQNHNIETYLLLTDPEIPYISSTIVKALQKDHADIHKHVPLNVKQKLEQKISEQYLVGITGEISSGKSYIAKKFVKLGKQKGIQVHNIEFDNLGHKILKNTDKYSQVREDILKEFKEKIKLPDGSINRNALGEVVFSNPEKREKLNKILHPPIIQEFYNSLYNKKGIILVNAALIAESGISYLCNNNVVLVKTNKDIRYERLKNRGLNHEQITNIDNCQYNFKQKKKSLEESIQKDNYGNLWTTDNSPDTDKNIKDTFEKITNYFLT